MTSQDNPLFGSIYTRDVITQENPPFGSIYTRDVTTQDNPTAASDGQTSVHTNESIPDDCIRIVFSEWEYLPWANPDNVVGRAVLQMTARVRINLLHVLFLIGGPANVINMAVFFKQSLKDRVNLLLFSLALADELCLMAYVSTYFEQFCLQFSGGSHAVGPSPVLLFQVNNGLVAFHSLGYVSFVLSAIIACERCCCVLWPLSYQTMIRTRTVGFVVSAVYVVCPGLYFLVASKYHFACVYDPVSGVVGNMYSQSEFYRRHKDLVDYTDQIVYGAGLPSAMLVVVVTATAITITKLRQTLVWRAGAVSSSSSRSSSSSLVSSKEVALTKMLVGTSVLLIGCVSPCLLRVVILFVPDLNTGGRYENLYYTLVYVAQMFLFVNSSFNIFIYYAMGTRYRQTFWSLFKRTMDPITQSEKDVD